jgi:hypothetical protein
MIADSVERYHLLVAAAQVGVVLARQGAVACIDDV